ncbi:MAG: tyrosine-protein phosphatase [Synergistaceae bacterium]|nr:tyrosine-protein phosphatase [Synergistaceae bacterium]MBR0034368.1 tyrosine-protein phosphatase [Synergistaceae bacterium]
MHKLITKQFVLMLELLILFLFACGCGASETIRSQSIGLSGVGNARELGGYSGLNGKTVKHGVLLRTAALANAASEDLARLQDVYHLAVVADLRMTMEAQAAPDPEIPGAKNLHLRIIDEQAMQQTLAEAQKEGLDLSNKLDLLKAAIKSGFISDQMYINFLSGKQGKESYGIMFQEILALPEGKSLLFHCSQGKDRTGCAAMLILSALGVDEKTIMDDFQLTNTFNAELIESERKLLTENGYSGEELNRLMKAMDEVDPQYMTNALDWMKENYGSVTGYITQELGVTDEQLETLRAKFLE